MASVLLAMDEAFALFESGNGSAAVDRVVYQLDHVRRSMSNATWRLVARWIAAHPIVRYLHQDPFTHRAFAKPRAYAGDAVMMDYIYGIDVPDVSPAAEPVSAYTTGFGCAARAVRFRRQALADAIDQTAVACGRSVQVTAVAAGHLREAALSTALQQGLATITAIDQDADSLAVIERDYGSLGVRAVPRSVRRILSGRLSIESSDLISAGLYDYLAQPVAARLTEVLFSCLAPRGRLLIANFMPSIPDIGYMESFMDWHLIYRDDADMRMLTTGLPAGEIASIRQFRDPLDAITFLEIARR